VAAIFWRNHRRIQRLRREAPVLPGQPDAGVEAGGPEAILESLPHPGDLD
jgi:hypothetical protein